MIQIQLPEISEVWVHSVEIVALGAVFVVNLLIRIGMQKSQIEMTAKFDRLKGEVESKVGAMQSSLGGEIKRGHEVLEEKIIEGQGDIRNRLDGLKDDMNTKHLENQKTIVGHTAADEEYQKGVSRTLTRMEADFQRMEDRLNATIERASRS